MNVHVILLCVPEVWNCLMRTTMFKPERLFFLRSTYCKVQSHSTQKHLNIKQTKFLLSYFKKKMNDLMLMGFDEAAARDALQESNGNFNAALEFLLGGNVSSISSDNVLVLDVSQYSFSEAGSSACTVIAVTAAQTLLKRLNNGDNISDAELLSDIVMTGSNLFTEQSQYAGHQHSSVDELNSAIKGDLKVIGSFQGISSTDRAFEEMLKDVRAVAVPGRYIGIVITKPPETVCVIIPPINAPSGGTFALFDSHSRPQWGYDGAYLLTSTSEEDVVRHLHKLFPPLDLGPGATEHMQMYNMFEATAFQ